MGRDSSVGIATGYGLDGTGEVTHRFVQALRPTQPPVQWVPGLSRGLSARGVVLTTHPLLAPRVKLYLSSPLLALRGLLQVELHFYKQDGPELLSRYSDSLRAGGFGDRIPVGARFSAPVQKGPRAHPASYTMGTGTFPGVKRPGCGANHPRPFSIEVIRVSYTSTPPLGPRAL
jgi:hypothetical protein